MAKTRFHLGFSHFFGRGLQSIAPATKKEHGSSEVLHLPRGIITMSQIKHDDSFTQRDFRPFQHVLQFHQVLCLPRKMASKTKSAESATPATRMKKCPMACTCHAKRRPQNVPDIPRLPRKWT